MNIKIDDIIKVQRLIDGTIWITVPNDEFVTVEVENAGIPGIVGPNMSFNINELVNDAQKDARIAAAFSSEKKAVLG